LGQCLEWFATAQAFQRRRDRRALRRQPRDDRLVAFDQGVVERLLETGCFHRNHFDQLAPAD
jgi:hypothetical protein